jgi:hypothetical protein
MEPAPASEERAPAGRGAREGAHAGLGEAVLEGKLVGVLEGPGLDRLHAAQREEQQDRLLEPLVDDHLVGGVVDLGHAGLARIEKLNGLLHDLGRVGVCR